jgi:hypothetical protein
MKYAGSNRRERAAAEARWHQLLSQHRRTPEGQQLIGFTERLVQLFENRPRRSQAGVAVVAEDLVQQARLEHPLVSTREVVGVFRALPGIWCYGRELLEWYLQGGVSLMPSYNIHYRGYSDGGQSAAAVAWAHYNSIEPRAYALAVRLAAAVEAEASRSRVLRRDVPGMVRGMMPLAIVAVGRDLSTQPSGHTAPRGRFVQITSREVDLAFQMLCQYWVHGAALEQALAAQG